MEKKYCLNRRWVLFISLFVLANGAAVFAQKTDTRRLPRQTDEAVKLRKTVASVEPGTGYLKDDRGSNIIDPATGQPYQVIIAMDPSSGQVIYKLNGKKVTVDKDNLPLLDTLGQLTIEAPVAPPAAPAPVVTDVKMDRTTKLLTDLNGNPLKLNEHGNPEFDAKGKFQLARPIKQLPSGQWVDAVTNIPIKVDATTNAPRYDNGNNPISDPQGKPPVKKENSTIVDRTYDDRAIENAEKDIKKLQKRLTGHPYDTKSKNEMDRLVARLKDLKADREKGVVPLLLVEFKDGKWVFAGTTTPVKLNSAGNPMFNADGIPIADDGVPAVRPGNKNEWVYLNPTRDHWVDINGRGVKVDYDKNGIPAYNKGIPTVETNFNPRPIPENKVNQVNVDADAEFMKAHPAFKKNGDGKWVKTENEGDFLVATGTNGLPILNGETPVFIDNDYFTKKLKLNFVPGPPPHWMDADKKNVLQLRPGELFPFLDASGNPVVDKGATADQPFYDMGFKKVGKTWYDKTGKIKLKLDSKTGRPVSQSGDKPIYDDGQPTLKNLQPIPNVNGNVPDLGVGDKGKQTNKTEKVTVDKATEGCEKDFRVKLYELVSKDVDNVLGRMFELTAMKIALHILKQDPKAVTMEAFTRKRVDDLKKQVDAKSEFPQAVTKLYEQFYEMNDLKDIQQDLSERLDEKKGTCYWRPNLRLDNDHASAFVLAMSLSAQNNSGLGTMDAATIWAVEELRRKTENNPHFQLKGKHGNLMNISNRVARYLGRIEGGADYHGKADQLATKLKNEESDLNTRMEASIKKALTDQGLNDQMTQCYAKGAHKDCAACMQTDIKSFKDSQTVEGLKAGLLERVAIDDRAQMEANVQGKLGLKGSLGEVKFDFTNFAKGNVPAAVITADKTRKDWQDCEDADAKK